LLSDERRSDYRTDVTRRFVWVVLLAGVLLTAVVFLSANRADHFALERQRTIAGHEIDDQRAALPHDQESVAIWDEAVRKVSQNLDRDWADTNLGFWMHDYFRHDVTLVLDRSNRVIYGMRGDKQRIDQARVPAEVEPLVGDLRSRIAKGAMADFASGKSPNPRAVDLVRFGDHPAIVSVMPFVSDSGKLAVPVGTEALLVSVRYLDGDLLDLVARRHVWQRVRFGWMNKPTGGEASFALRRNSGSVLGYFIWRVEKPGFNIITEVLPFLIIAFAVVGAIVNVLLRRLRQSYMELSSRDAQSRQLAFYDPMSGLPNRALFNSSFDTALGGMDKGRGGLALVVLDLVRFGQLNDTFGHPTGDALIREVATRLGEIIGEKDLLARIGGDEFAIVLSDSSEINIEAFCSRLLARLGRPLELLGNSARIDAIMGVAIAPAHGIDRVELLRKAEIALHRAKDERASYRVFDESMDRLARTRQQLEWQLRAALDSGAGLELYYQPIVSARTRTISGLEALVRWNHPSMGLLPPAAFVPIAEESGLIDRLGAFVLERACQDARRWRVNTIAVNVSVVQCRNPAFAEQVFAILDKTGLPAFNLELELTENVFLDAQGASARTVERLRKGGIRIAIDDFGTGYSSLSYLRNFRVDRVKIDRSFIQHIGEEQISTRIVEAITDLAHGLNLHVTAEGVETELQCEKLAEIGCNDLQGYLFFPPLPRGAMDNLLLGATQSAGSAMLARSAG
jgi:diguanylate cyclase (GGDEF)-like protein